jgi:hypothetical protein
VLSYHLLNHVARICPSCYSCLAVIVYHLSTLTWKFPAEVFQPIPAEHLELLQEIISR